MVTVIGKLERRSRAGRQGKLPLSHCTMPSGPQGWEPVNGCDRKSMRSWFQSPEAGFASSSLRPRPLTRGFGKAISTPHQSPQVNVTVCAKGNTSGNRKTTTGGPRGEVILSESQMLLFNVFWNLWLVV